MRKTYSVPAMYSTQFRYQDQLNQMWNLIEDMYPEEWRQDSNGDVLLVVDDAMLERILTDNTAVAWYTFGSFKGGQREDGTKFFLNRPEHLKGTYILRGIYTPGLRLVPADKQSREYFFVQEGY